MNSRLLVSAADSLALDAEAQADWGFNAFSLIEAAGRNCARALEGALPGLLKNRPRIAVAAGAGNNGADAMAMLRYWILEGLVEPSRAALVLSRMPDGGPSPRSELVKSLGKMKVPVFIWGEGPGGDAGPAAEGALSRGDILIDGIAGSGLRGALRGAALEMAGAVNARGKSGGGAIAVSVDLPSGNSDEWEPGMPMVEADYSLAIEPQKLCLYTPAARPRAGVILPVGGIFPREAIARHKGAELLDWESARRNIPGIRPDVYKNQRGTVELRAGSPGASGAALIAARGAQAAGAGLVRLVVDDEIYPGLAPQTAGIMAAPESAETAPFEGRFKPDALLLGPGWGTGPERARIFEKALALEKGGVPLILDADAIDLARNAVFSGSAVLTPHPGEFARYAGIGREEPLRRPAPILLEYARRRQAVIVFKGHVIFIAAPDGRLGVVDGMSPGLAAGGSGDLLAGFCAAIAARMAKESRGADLYACACAAAALLIASGKSESMKNRFADPLELADKAADLAGEAWLGRDGVKERAHGRY